jgi:phage host-nuclease inhibitor protein Gam
MKAKTKMPKTKTNATPPAPAIVAPPVMVIADCDDADRRGLELGRAHLEREALQNKVNQQKTAIDEKYAESLHVLATAENELQLALDAFAAKHGHKENLNYIEIISSGGGNAVTFNKDEADVIKRLERSKSWELVRVTKSVLKTDLRNLPKNLHKRLGFAFGPTAITFSVKPKFDAVKIYIERDRDRSPVIAADRQSAEGKR